MKGQSFHPLWRSHLQVVFINQSNFITIVTSTLSRVSASPKYTLTGRDTWIFVTHLYWQAGIFREPMIVWTHSMHVTWNAYSLMMKAKTCTDGLRCLESCLKMNGCTLQKIALLITIVLFTIKILSSNSWTFINFYWRLISLIKCTFCSLSIWPIPMLDVMD